MSDPEILLVFPPVVYTNFGRYYPSTAMLAGYLESHGVATEQWDVNQELLCHCIDRDRIRSILERGDAILRSVLAEGGDWTLNPRLGQLLAARAVVNRPGCFRDEKGRLLQANHPRAPHEVLSALSHEYFIDAPMKTITSPAFWDLPQVESLRAFIRERGLVERVPSSVRVLALSLAMGPQLGCGLVLASELRRRGLHTVIGGAVVTLLDDGVLESLLRAHPQIDAAVRYQGELPLCRLVDHVRRGGTRPWTVEGVLALGPEGLAGAADGLPIRGIRDLPFGKYEQGLLQQLATPEIAVRQAEGCYWGRCAYCDYVELYPAGMGRYQPQSVKRLVDEIEHHTRVYGVRSFCLITESLPAPVGRRMGEELLARGLDIRWNSFAMVDRHFDLPTLETMARSGCAYICVGVETVNDRVLKLVGKAATREVTVTFLENCREAGINLVINLIPNLPTMTRTEALEALSVFERHASCVVNISVFPFEVTRSSAIGKAPEKYGLEVSGTELATSGQAQFNANHLAVRDPAMSSEELEDVLARYRKLAARVALGNAGIESPATEEVDIRRHEWRYDASASELLIPSAEFDALGVLIYNWLSGRITHFSRMWCGIFRWLQISGRVPFAGIEGHVGEVTGLQGVEREAIAAFIVRRLESEGLLRRQTE